MYAPVNGIKLFFDVEGSAYVAAGSTLAERPPLFVLHGGPGCDHSYFKPWLSPLTEHVQLIYVDHRGNGRSDRADSSTYTIEQMADDLDALRAYLGLERVMVLGHSFGGMVAQVYALRYGETLSKLILASTTPSSTSWEEAQIIAERTATPEQKAVLADLFEGRIASQEAFDEWWRICLPLYFYKADDRVCATMLARMRGEVIVANYMMANVIPQFDVRDQLRTIQAPVLAVAGRQDWVTPPSQSVAIHNQLPISQLVILEHSGHMTFIDEQNDFIRVVGDFLSAASANLSPSAIVELVTSEVTDAAPSDAEVEEATPALTDIQRAAATLRGVARMTPVLNAPDADEVFGCRLHVKAEALQHTGSFKLRGAYNKLKSLTADERARGVLTVSAGNAALGLAYAARRLGVACEVIMPLRVSARRVAAVEAYGAHVVRAGKSSSEMFALAEQRVRDGRLVFIHPFAQPEVIAGQGTVALELLDVVPDLRLVVVAASGGGLLAGMATAIKALHPEVAVVGIQPEGSCSIKRSLAAGEVVDEPVVSTIADALTAQRCGELNLRIIQRLVDDVLLVTDEQILAGVRFAWQHYRLALEPAGAAGLAGLLCHSELRRGIVGTVACGSNLEPADFVRALT